MKLYIQDMDISQLQGIIIPVFEDQASEYELVEQLKENERFSGKIEEIFYFTTEQNKNLKYNILVGLGKEADLTGDQYTQSIAKAVKQAKELKLTRYGIKFGKMNSICAGGRVKGLTQAVGLATYTFEKYKSDATNYEAEVYILDAPQDKRDKMNQKLEEMKNLVEGVIIARDLVNEPANVIYPESLAQRVVEIGQVSGFEVEVFDEKQIQTLGMEAFWAVGKGSDRLPRFIVMRYMGDKESEEILGLVGKGLTYDTGGYSLKPNDSMKDMKSDMGGAAAVIGVMSALAKNKVKTNVVAVIAAAENAISGHSYKPGDIIGSMAGKTIEILNTDAEGRLTLVDAITYVIQKENVSKVIDLATLTGAALVALGNFTTAVLTNNQDLYRKLEIASEKTGELFWQLPSFNAYKKQIKGDYADLKNIGGKFAGTITAGLFIEEFVQGKPWLHLDIAGPAWADAPFSELVTRGGTGVPVRTIYQMLTSECNCNH
ncbi:MAG: leucyl aminopeptidase [Peptostreptococcaceae bacterium]